MCVASAPACARCAHCPDPHSLHALRARARCVRFRSHPCSMRASHALPTPVLYLPFFAVSFRTFFCSNFVTPTCFICKNKRFGFRNSAAGLSNLEPINWYYRPINRRRTDPIQKNGLHSNLAGLYRFTPINRTWISASFWAPIGLVNLVQYSSDSLRLQLALVPWRARTL